MLVPQTNVTKDKWNTSNTLKGAYKSSYMHNTVLPNIVTKLKTVLGTHIVNRNVLLSSSVDDKGYSYYSSTYTWTTSDATLMSIGQMNGKFASHRNKYDDGEANYKLPIFNSQNYYTGSTFWSRCVCDGSYGNYFAWRVYSEGSINVNRVSNTDGVRPLIYLR